MSYSLRQPFSHSISKARPHSNSKPSVKFSEIDSQLRDDTSMGQPALSGSDQKSAKVTVAAPEDDGNIDDGTIDPWLDDKPPHCGSATMFDVESYIDLDRPELLGILASDPPDKSTAKEADGPRDIVVPATVIC